MTDERANPLQLALDRVGDRWSFLVVESLLLRPMRFSEIREAIPGIAPNILADRLRRLDASGVLVPRPYQERPPRVEYGLSADGRELAGVLRLLADWGGRGEANAQHRHVACGTPLDARWYCPTCSVEVADPAEEPAYL